MRNLLIAVVGVILGSFGSARAEYTPPLPNPKVFTGTLTLEESSRVQTVDVLVDWSRSRISEGKPLAESDWKKISRAMALSKLLKSSNRGYVIANFQLSSRATPTKPERVLSDIEASDLLFKAVNGTELKRSEKKDDQILYGYLIEMVASLNPANEDAIVEFSLQKEKEPINWDILVPGTTSATIAAASTASSSSPSTPIPGVEGKTWSGPPLRSIKVLLVVQTGAGIWVGKTNNLIGTVSSTRPEGGVSATFDRTIFPESSTTSMGYESPTSNNAPPRQPSAPPSRSNSSVENEQDRVGNFGSEMRITLDEALRLVNSRHLGLKSAPAVTLGFEDKYTPKDGGSIGAACTLLLLSIVDNYEIDPVFAVTGDINADGKIKAVGGIDAKIEGAFAGSAKAVMIPSENKTNLEEMVVMNQEKLLGKVQVFSISNIQEAQDLVRVDKPENIKKAMELFQQLQDKGSFPKEKLEEILQLAPNHLSARVFTQMADGSIPRKLSFKTSINRLIGSAAPFVSILLLEKNRNMNIDRTDKFTIQDMPQHFFEATRSELDKISGKIDPRAQNLYFSITQLISAWEELQATQSKTSSASNRRNFLEARTSFHDNLNELQMNEASIKELVR